MKGVVEYFVEGIPDSRENKSMLYQTHSVKELKEQIRVYERIKGASVASRRAFSQSSNASGDTEDQVKRRCYRCNQEGHLARDCSRGEANNVICFKC